METENEFPAPNLKTWRKNALVEITLRNVSQPGFNLQSRRNMTSDVLKLLHFGTIVTKPWFPLEWPC